MLCRRYGLCCLRKRKINTVCGGVGGGKGRQGEGKCFLHARKMELGTETVGRTRNAMGIQTIAKSFRSLFEFKKLLRVVSIQQLDYELEICIALIVSV